MYIYVLLRRSESNIPTIGTMNFALRARDNSSSLLAASNAKCANMAIAPEGCLLLWFSPKRLSNHSGIPKKTWPNLITLEYEIRTYV